MNYNLGSISKIGNRSENQDRVAMVETPGTLLMILGDGMGGRSGGKLAADTLVASLKYSFKNASLPLLDPMNFLEKAIDIAHRNIVQAGANHRPRIEPRTTCVVCIIQDGCAWWTHIGDSRLYLLRNGEILARTLDHSRVERLYQKGLISAEQRYVHPDKNILTRCLGSEIKPQATFSTKISLKSGDVIFICSDGLWGALSDFELCPLLRAHNLTDSLNALAELAESNCQPHSDNISAIALNWLAESPPKQIKKQPDIKDQRDKNRKFETMDPIA
jgi:serine/threonine protein phosphatase PrpC